MKTLNVRTAKIEVGTRVHCILYGGKDGIVYGVHGVPDPSPVGDLGGVVSFGGRVTYDIVFPDHLSKGVFEAVVRGVQWRVYDEPLATADEIVEAISAANAVRAAAEEAGRVASERRAAERAKHAAENPGLVKVGDKPDWSASRVVAENVRRELKALFPATKFKITKTGYDSVSVKWADGPTEKMVEAVTGKYDGYKSDPWNDDLQVRDHDATFTDVFGDCKYLSLSRDATLAGMRFAWANGRALWEADPTLSFGTADEVPEKWWESPRSTHFRRTWAATDLTGKV